MTVFINCTLRVTLNPPHRSSFQTQIVSIYCQASAQKYDCKLVTESVIIFFLYLSTYFSSSEFVLCHKSVIVFSGKCQKCTFIGTKQTAFQFSLASIIYLSSLSHLISSCFYFFPCFVCPRKIF